MSIQQQIEAPTPNGKSVVTAQSIHVPTAPASDATSLMQVIERAAMNPDVDIDKMDRLWAMYERIGGKRAEQEFANAMCDAQAEMEPIRANCDNSQTHSRYASYAALDRDIRPIYTRHGFSLSFNTTDGAPEGWVRLICDVSHRSGHVKPYRLDVPADGKGAKGGDVMTKTHATGSALSYGSRYLAGMIFNLAIDKDKDGNGASPRVTIRQISEKQLNILTNLIDETNADIRKVCAHFEIEGLAILTTDRYQEAFELLKARKRAK
jgi:hypothetical protein